MSRLLKGGILSYVIPLMDKENILRIGSYFLGIAFLLLAAFYPNFTDRANEEYGKTTIVLSSNYEDAALYLGGLLSSEGGKKIVVTVFGAIPDEMKSGAESILSEHRKALSVLGANSINYAFLSAQYRKESAEQTRFDIERSLRSLLEAYPEGDISVYAPAALSDGEEGDPDTLLVAGVFADLASSYFKERPLVNYFFYEDIKSPRPSDFLEAGFMASVGGDYEFRETPLYMNGEALDTKIRAISSYRHPFFGITEDIAGAAEARTSQRCDKSFRFSGCESVYSMKAKAER